MSTAPSPASVRSLYTPPQEDWLFLPPNVSAPNSSSANTSSKPSSTPFSTSTSDTFFSGTDLSLDGSDDTEPFSLYSILQVFTAEYLTTALGMPFEVGKTLLQVEYKPKPAFAEAEEAEMTVDQDEEGEQGRDWGAEDDHLSNPEEAEAYFSDVLSSSHKAFVPIVEDSVADNLDEDGYLPDLHPSYLIRDDVSPSSSTGVWGMMRRLRRTPSEGLPSLWKGQLLMTFHSLLSASLQPTLHTLLLVALPDTAAEESASFHLPLASHPSPGLPLGLHITSHLLTHLFLSPLELLRTRIILQPTSLPNSVSSPSMLKSILANEGGISSLYLHPHLLVPSLLEHTLRPLLTLSIPLFIERKLLISPELSPITYSVLDLSLGLASLLILLPVETIRKRLQLQDRSTDDERIKRGGRKKEKKGIVRLRKGDYVGVVDGMWRIASEETDVVRRKKRRPSAQGGVEKEETGGAFDGIKQLYRGFGMAATAHLTVFGLGLVSAGLGGGRVEYGWKEI